jgi:hypothetical protein
MNPSESLLAKVGLKHSLDAFVPGITGPQTIPMTHQAFDTVPDTPDGFFVDLNAQLFREIAHRPHVVIARMKVNRQACIGQFGQSTQHADATLGDSPPVLEPKIKQVAHHMDFRGFRALGESTSFRCVTQPSDKPPFTRMGCSGVGCTEV